MQIHRPAVFAIASVAYCLVGFVSVASAQALKLDDRLAPPQSVTIPALPVATQPASRESVGKRTAKPAPLGQESQNKAAPPLPISEIPRTPSAPNAETRRTTWKHPALDAPDIASAAHPLLPIETRLPVTAGAFVRGPQPDQPLAETRTPRDAELPPPVANDPKAMATFRYLTSPVAAAAPVPAPLLRLTIPDPWSVLQQSRLPIQDLDRDPPTVPLDRPVR